MAHSAFSALISVNPTANEIGVTAGLYPIISIANNPVLPSTGSVSVPSGTTAQRVLGLGALRLNTETGFFEVSTDNLTWVNLAVGGGGIASVTGTALQIDVTAGVNPVISIDPGYLGQASITTLGTIATGTWAGTAIAVIHGGTGLTSTTINQLLYSSAANTIAGLATGNNGVLITSAGGVPSISSTLPAAVQGNITSLGTIATGVWNGTVIGGTYGGTGVNNGANTITLGGNILTAGAHTLAGAFASTFTFTGATNVTFPTSGTLVTTSSAGSITFIASATAANSATIDFSNNLSATYDNYMITIENLLPATNAVTFQSRVGTGAGPTYQTSGYSGYILSNAGVLAFASGTGAVDMTTTSRVSNASNRVGNGVVWITNVNNASNDKIITSEIDVWDSTGTTDTVSISGGRWQSATVITSIRFLYSSGNITSGVFRLYGIQN